MAKHISPTYVKAFRDTEKLEDMLAMRKKGWTLKSLALLFSVDHTSIYNRCKIAGIGRVKNPISFSISDILDDIRLPVFRQKTYLDYLREDKNRRLVIKLK